MRRDVLLGVSLQASLMAERFAGWAGHAEGGVGVSELVSAAPVSEHAVMAISDCVALKERRDGISSSHLQYIPTLSPDGELTTVRK